ncbi:type IX secretion system protein PorQ [Chitinophaga horti]|uniref:Type IX secretion system protein PorQ n=1 Tax=Chitinophaga horti TaxID=2920382 RepID=A0ABY6IZR0_9BACT|nr:type IX secretion system protein PorQ [Chitinophaga horti]UYQ91479.1 type IX secretion system protein PorQ [Chitinophaga horti]
MQKIAAVIVLLLSFTRAQAQVLGGKHVFSFLDLPPAPQVTALGNMNAALQTDDLSATFLNPALLRPSMHTHLQVNYADYFAGVNYSHVMAGYHVPSIGTTFATSLQFVNYGNIVQTDAAGNIQGSFKPSDMSWQVTASRQYKERWNYGLTLKYIRSRYQQYRSTGFSADMGITYQDTAKGWQVGLVAKNMGSQIKSYGVENKEPLPFDLQVGISKKLEHVPLQLSATIHHIYQFDINYEDPDFDEGQVIENGDTLVNRAGAIDKVFRHFVLAAQFTVGKHVELTAAYNHLRRQELALLQQQGMSGFSFGVGVIITRLQIRYARSFYQNSTAFNHFGINLPLNQWTGLGTFGEKIGW